MNIEEIINTAKFANENPGVCSSGEKVLGHAYLKLQELDFLELQYYFQDEDIIRLFTAVKEEQNRRQNS